MKSLIAGRRALQWVCCFGLLSGLGACQDDASSVVPEPAPTAPTPTYTVGGTVSGLASAAMLTLVDNDSDPLSLSSDGAFRFHTSLAAFVGYAVTVSGQPSGQTCTVKDGTGTMGAANVANIAVSCSDQSYLLGGTVHGLIAAGLILANGGATVAVPSDAQTFTLPAAIAYGSSYNVTVKKQPTGLACSVTAGSGSMPAHALATVMVNCVAQRFSIGGSISGLGASTGLVLVNGTDSLTVLPDSTSFAMPTPLASGAHYSLLVQTQPSGGICSVSNGAGIVAGAAVATITVACVIHTESVLHSFGGAPGDGAQPWYGSLLLASDGNLYGLTPFGGANSNGTVFKITPAGVETVLWSFGSGTDGSNPYGTLIQASDGNLYGMTNLGGLYGRGTVFKITPAGVETVLWSFGSGTDGSNPYGTLIQASDGNLYGMTYQGGVYGGYVGQVYVAGTVFKITPAGVETVIWSFGNGTDGSLPYGKLVLGGDGNFYSMTYAGGVNGQGTIFKITAAGTETVLWSFGASGDGTHPTGNPIFASDGNFYGMTIDGGANNSGVIFKMTPAGVESVLYSLGNAGAGAFPQGSLLQGLDGNLYGMAGLGGLAGTGTLLEITLSGAESVLYSFGAGGTASDAEIPYGSLVQAPDGTFYGMTTGGGTQDMGTVFKFK